MESIIANETKIYYSKQKTVRGMRVAAVFGVIGFLLPVISGGQLWAWYFGVLIIIGATIIGISIFKNYKNRQPQITISESGIQTSTIPLCPWKYITGEDVVELNEGKTTGYYLIYDYPYGHAKYPLYLLDTDNITLSGIIKMYREKNRQSESAASKS